MNTIDFTKAEDLFREFNVSFAGVFGSYARNEQTQKSDLDILIRYSKTPGYIKYMRLQRLLSELFNVKVDLVTEPAVSPHIIDYILKDLKPFYGSR